MTLNKLEAQRCLYGRKFGRPLSIVRQKALDDLMPVLSIQNGIMKVAAGSVDPKTLFSTPFENICIEIGFGDGEHLARLMERHLSTGFIGAEPFINGMSAFLKSIQEDHLNQNQIRVWMDDAILLLEKFSNETVDTIYVLNPDPWPKVRHHKRRIINDKNLDLFARIMKPGGMLVMATDVDDLAEWMVTHAQRHSAFRWAAEKAEDWQMPPYDWIETRYEQKGRTAGRRQTYLLFRRK